jgi:hypothetical protein
LVDRNYVPPGQRFAIMLVPLSTLSDTPVRLESVWLTGSGIGSVIKVVSMSLAPEQPSGHAVPETTYLSDPPVWNFEHRCLVQRLEPFHGVVLHKGQVVRVYVVLKARQRGKFDNTGYHVTYQAKGTTYTQDLDVGYTTWVRHGVPRRTPHPSERSCFSLTHRL